MSLVHDGSELLLTQWVPGPAPCVQVFGPVPALGPSVLGLVAQIHIAGHSRYEKYILDTHDHPVIDPVWALYARAIERCGPTATLLEWDDRIPSFKEVHDEALKANAFIGDAKAAQPARR